ncbi:hypothetical protein VP01_1336g1 [Puccinia sorghi]|uniref:Uncharacterized protein n=1 Tax=Puccinia sorghi TaxID=27349 RepID=A0A0L6VMK4_9BASI|nr:hypothetical protein VP01_1336g1 [Puccinia sorghi]
MNEGVPLCANPEPLSAAPLDPVFPPAALGNTLVHPTLPITASPTSPNCPRQSKQLREMNVQSPNYALAAAKPKTIPKPPKKNEIILSLPGKTIIHLKLKKAGCKHVVQKTKNVLKKMNMTVKGEKVVQILPSGDVTFFFQECMRNVKGSLLCD